MKPGMATFLKRVVYTTAKRYSAAFNRISFESCLFVNLSTSSTSTAPYTSLCSASLSDLSSLVGR